MVDFFFFFSALIVQIKEIILQKKISYTKIILWVKKKSFPKNDPYSLLNFNKLNNKNFNTF